MLRENFFVDTNIFMYARGGSWYFKEACLRTLNRIVEEGLPAFTSAEVLQEIIHRYVAIGRSEFGRQLVDHAVLIVPTVLPVTKADALRAARLSSEYPRLPSRDLVHVAVMLQNGIEAILTADGHFDNIPQVRRIDPGSF